VKRIEIRYHNKATEKLCTDLKKARKELNNMTAVKLHALINLLESAETLQDIAALQIYHLHPMAGKPERKTRH